MPAGEVIAGPSRAAYRSRRLVGRATIQDHQPLLGSVFCKHILVFREELSGEGPTVPSPSFLPFWSLHVTIGGSQARSGAEHVPTIRHWRTHVASPKPVKAVQMVDIEYDTTGPQPHRCNARVEDFIQTLYTGDWGGKVLPAWRLTWRCIFSTQGEEPKEPYIMFTDAKPYLVRRRKKSGWEKVEERLNSK